MGDLFVATTGACRVQPILLDDMSTQMTCGIRVCRQVNSLWESFYDVFNVPYGKHWRKMQPKKQESESELTVSVNTCPLFTAACTLNYLARANSNVSNSDDKLAAAPTTHFSLRIAHRVHAPEILFRQLLQLRYFEAAHLADAADAGYAWCQDGDAGCGAYSY